jgi:peptidylamidoglycolate lyase
MPHGITVAGSDVWLTDVGLHQVFKFSTRGQLLLTLGSRLKPGNDRQHFCKPTSVAVQEGSGAVFVADG